MTQLNLSEHRTSKGFLFLSLTSADCIRLFDGGLGLCDHCLTRPEGAGYYIPVLTRYLCPDCFSAWHTGATNFPDDHAFELKMFRLYHNKLNRLKANDK